MTHYFVDATGPDTAALTSAVGWLVQQIQESGKPGLILASTKVQFTDSILTGVLGGPACRALAKGAAVEGVLHGATERTFRHEGHQGPVLILWPDQKLLDRADCMRGALSFLAVPWLPQDIAAWRAQWAATELGSGEATAASVLPPDVEKAMPFLSAGKSISHPMDHDRALARLKELHSQGHVLDPVAIRGHLVAVLRWQPQDAARVAEMAEKIVSGRRIRRRSRF